MLVDRFPSSSLGMLGFLLVALGAVWSGAAPQVFVPVGVPALGKLWTVLSSKMRVIRSSFWGPWHQAASALRQLSPVTALALEKRS